MTKILWHSNAPWVSTGYGNQTALMTPLLEEHHDVAISSFYGLDGACLNYGKKITVFPGIAGTYGNETIEQHAKAFFEKDSGLVMTLMDVWVLEPEIWRKLNTLSWVPVDHDPLTSAVAKFFAESGAVPMAMSRFGEEQLREFDPLYCPHGIDTTRLKPWDQTEARKTSRLPQDKFIVGMVAANKGNPSRKRFPEALRAFKALRERHDDVVLYLHTEMMGLHMDGVHLPNLVNDLKLGGSVHITDQYRYQFSPFNAETMGAIYSSMDVLLNPSAGEGFGIPIIEAQACGTPVIVTDFTAMSELCGAGWKIESEPVYTAQMSWQANPDVEDMVEALECAYAMSKAGRDALRNQARGFAVTYDARKVLDEHMLPAIESAQERFTDREPVAV